MIITIDGSAASSKGTLAKQLARYLGYDYLDTGALYRAVALSILKSGKDSIIIDENQALKCASTLDLGLIKDPQIRTDSVASLASKEVAQVNSVRSALLALQPRLC